MRNYWIRILLGALAVFAIGMIGVTLVRKGAVRVNDVVNGSGPISLPLAFIPFAIGGHKLGTLERVVLERTAPKKIASVRIEVKLADSLVAQGLSGCRLAANLDTSHKGEPGIHIQARREDGGTFRCIKGESADSSLVEFGRAVLQPGEVTLPLLLPRELVEDLQTGEFWSDSTTNADSVTQAVEALADSISAAEDRKMDSVAPRNDRLEDSLRGVGRRQVDSLKQAALRLADSARAASLKGDASRPR